MKGAPILVKGYSVPYDQLRARGVAQDCVARYPLGSLKATNYINSSFNSLLLLRTSLTYTTQSVFSPPCSMPVATAMSVRVTLDMIMQMRRPSTSTTRSRCDDRLRLLRPHILVIDRGPAALGGR